MRPTTTPYLLGILFWFVGLFSLASAHHTDHPSSESKTGELGQITFPTSGKPEAHTSFIRGVLFLHHFEYDDAKGAFQTAQTLDPGFAMAYWGEAMTENHPLWLEQDRETARAVLNRLASTPEERVAKANTGRETLYLKAIDILYGEGDKVSRDKAYAEAMRKLVERYPDDLEAAAFYALALLGTAQGERDFGIYMKAAGIAEGVFQQHPRHPGAVHYLIHAYDDPIHAPLGLRPARIYASIAPAAPHAQHMPSHIFMALGMWDEVVRANESSWAASEVRIKRKGLSLHDRPYHTLYWLMYAYLQQGRHQEAKKLVDLVKEDSVQSPSRSTRSYLASMRATYTIESRQWDIGALNEDRSALRVSAAASEWFALGMSAVKMSNLVAAKEALRNLNQQIKSKGTRESTNQIRTLKVMMMELKGMIRLAEGEISIGMELLKHATTIEDTLPFAYGPPIPVKPAHELLGEILLDLGQPKEARHEFTVALGRAPNRALSLRGLAKTPRDNFSSMGK